MPRPDDLLLSAYIDGELIEPVAGEFRKRLESDPDLRQRAAELGQLKTFFGSDTTPDLSERMTRSYATIRRRVIVRSRSGILSRWQQVRVPLPAVAAAATIVLALAAVLVWSFVSSNKPVPANYLAGGQNVDVTIRVDDIEMERVLEWLAEKQMLGEVSIQLPEQQWSIVGEPVLMKPDELPRGFSE